MQTGDDLVERALESESFGQPTALTPTTAPTIDRLADLTPSTLALMHGPAFHGDAAVQLRGLAAGYRSRLEAALAS